MGANTVPVLTAQRYELREGTTTLLVVTTGGQFQYTLRQGTQTYTYDSAVTNDRYLLDGNVIAAIFLATGDTCVAEIHPGFNEATAGTVAIQGTTGAVFAQDSQGAMLVVAVGPTVPTDSQSVGPTSLAAASAESVIQAGANPIPVGVPVTYNGSTAGALATVADVLSYVALKGHASAIYYATIFAGPSVDSSVLYTSTLEKLDIVGRNQDTVAHGLAFNWLAGK